MYLSPFELSKPIYSEDIEFTVHLSICPRVTHVNNQIYILKLLNFPFTYLSIYVFAVFTIFYVIIA